MMMNTPTILSFITVVFLASLARKKHTSGSPKKDEKNKNGKWILGVDVGGSSVKFVVMDGSSNTYSAGSILTKFSVPLISKTPSPEQLVAQIRETAIGTVPGAMRSLRAIGVCIPGRVENHAVSTVSNLGWKNNEDRPVRLGQMISDAFGCDRVLVENDAKTALLGEMWVSEASSLRSTNSGSNNVVMITFGTGIGGAVAVQGKILKGATGMLGEFGHSIIQCYHNLNNLEGVTYRRSSTTGVEGIVEDYCSSRGIRESWDRFNAAAATTTIIPFPGVDEVLRRAEMASSSPSLSGETNEEEETMTKKCVTVANFTLACVGALMVNVARYYDPSLVILAGGFVENGEWFRKRVESETDERFWSIGRRNFQIVRNGRC